MTPTTIRPAATLSLFESELAAGATEPYHDCIDVATITEPCEEQRRDFANGALIGLLHPMPGDLAGTGMSLGCFASLSDRDGRGFFGEVMIEETEAAYDPATGLTLRVPVRYATGPRGLPVEDVVVITVNQATGWVTAE